MFMFELGNDKTKGLTQMPTSFPPNLILSYYLCDYNFHLSGLLQRLSHCCTYCIIPVLHAAYNQKLRNKEEQSCFCVPASWSFCYIFQRRTINSRKRDEGQGLKKPFCKRSFLTYRAKKNGTYYVIHCSCKGHARDTILQTVRSQVRFPMRSLMFYVNLSFSLCGLVVRVLGYRSGGPGSIPGTTKKKK
jgi:hypothetical protein